MPLYANALPVSEEALSRLKTLFETINVGNGYRTDVEAVYRFRLAGWEIAEIVAMTFVAVRHELKRITGMASRYDVTMRIEGQAHIPIEPTEELEPAHNALMLDVAAALDSDPTLAADTGNNLVREMALESWELQVVEAEAPFSVSNFVIVVKYQAASGDMTRPF